ncbi:MAG: HK97-gp10 family putative phage morphogenesis protein [Lactococcus garvieae]
MAIVKGFNEFAKKIDKMSRDFPNEKRQMLEQMGELVITNIKQETPVVTGQLRQENKKIVLNDNAVTVYNNTEYARHVEFGTGRFEGRYYMKNGIENSKEEIQALLEDTVRRVMG